MVARFFFDDVNQWWRKWSATILALFWTVGLICGFLVFLCADESVSSLMRRAVASPVSIVSLLISLLFPFLLSALAVFLSKPRLLLIIAFCKAFLLMYVTVCVRSAFGSAGWLVQALYMASDILTLPLLYRYWLQHIRQNGSFRFGNNAMYFLAAVAAGFLDYFYISPLLLGLF